MSSENVSGIFSASFSLSSLNKVNLIRFMSDAVHMCESFIFPNLEIQILKPAICLKILTI